MQGLVDHRGLPIKAAALREEIVTPELTGIRNIWQDSIASGLTPAGLVAVLERSVNEDPRDYLTLAEEIEERDGHYFSVLGTRKLAVESIEAVIEAASDDAADVRLADEVRALFALECVQNSRADLLDGLGKSFSVCEIQWDRSERQWTPLSLQHCDPRWFVPDRLTGRELRLRDAADTYNGIELAPFKFVIHKPRLKSGLPIRNGLARIAAFMWLCKAYALKDWLAFAEVFGMPVRVGKYGPNATDADKRALRRAVANIGSDAAAVMPESMKLEFLETGSRTGGGDLFEKLCSYLDRQMSKVVLGQTNTTDAQAGGLGSGQADVHNEVRGDIRDADCSQLASTYQRDLVKPYIDLNHGPQKRYPRVVIRKRKPEDIKQLADVLAQLVPLGLRVEQSVVRDKLSLPDPERDAEVLSSPRPATPSPSAPTAQNLALNSALPPVPSVDVVDLQVARLTGDAAEIQDQLMAPIWALLDEVQSMEELRERIDSLYPDLAPDALADLMGDAMTAAQLAGRYDVLRGL
ncbi:MAG: DUF935 domain-containing protein [Panacagrimonas sp.]